MTPYQYLRIVDPKFAVMWRWGMLGSYQGPIHRAHCTRPVVKPWYRYGSYLEILGRRYNP